MRFCIKCSQKITHEKFCSNCGEKIHENKNRIDNTVFVVQENFNSIKNEVKKELTESKIIKKVKNETIPKVYSNTITILGYSSIVIILSQFFLRIFKNKIFPFEEIYKNCFGYNSDISLSVDNIACFIGRMLPTTILPFLFIFLLGRKKSWVMVTFGFSILTMLFLSTTRSVDSINYNFENKNEPISDTAIVNIDSISNSQDDNFIENEDNNKFNYSDKFNYNNEIFYYQIHSIKGNNYEYSFKVFDYNKEVYSDVITIGKIQNFKNYGKYLYFECDIPGGSRGNHLIDYLVFDFKQKKLHKLGFSCDDPTYEYCQYENLEVIKKNLELYEFYMNTIPKHEVDDNYFHEN